jgi:hypothetical protein
MIACENGTMAEIRRRSYMRESQSVGRRARDNQVTPVRRPKVET